MNGCLIRVVLLTIVLILIFSFISNNSEEIKRETNKIKGMSEVITKTIRYISK